MANGGSIKYNIGFNVDKSGLNQLKSSLQEIKNMTAKDFMNITGGNDLSKAKKELDEIHRTLGKVDAAFESAFNSDLGTLNIAKFNQTLSSSGLTIQKIQADLARTGTAGQNAFRNMTSQILTTNMKLKESHTLIDSMATTMANTIKWGAASSVMNSFTGTVQRAYGYVKSLDSSLNDIRIVTGKSADEMDRFAEKANKAAKNLGQTTTNYTDAALIYYQQGLSDAEVQARAEVTLKAANVTGQSGAEVSEQLTAVWNGYKVTAAEAELYIDKLAAVAAKTASDLEELSTGMSKVASAANLMGVDVDQLNAQLATIVSVTRQAPESVGTALKTIYARMGDIEAGLDSETTLGDYTKKMAAMGVNVLDMNGQLRDMGEVMEEIGGKWTSMSREQQVYLSQVMAGTRQYNNLLSLFDNWDQYTKSLETSANAAGTLQEQQDIYMESTQAHLAQLKASWEDLYDSLLDADAINGVSDALSGMVSLMANFVDSIGGGSGLLLALGAIGTKVFSKQIAGGLMTLINNLNVASDNILQLKAEMQLTSDLGILPGLDSRTQQLVQMKKEFLELGQNVTNEERELSNELIKQTNELFKQEDLLNKKKENVQDIYNRFTGGNINVDDSTKVEKETAKASLQVQRDEFTQVSSDLGEMEKSVDLQKQIVLSTKQLDELNTKIAFADEDRKKDLQEQAEKLEKQISLLEKQNARLQDAEGAIEQMSHYRDMGMFNSEQSTLLDETISKFHELTDGLDKTTPKYQTAVKNLAQIFKQVLGGAISDIDVAIDGISEGFQQEAEQIKNNQIQVKAAFDELKNSVDLRNAIQGTVQMIGAMGQLASTINNIRQLGNIWSNDDLTAGEKILQTVQNLGFAVPMLVTAITTLKNSYGDLAKSMSGVLLSVKKYIFALGQQTNSTITNTIATSGGTAANLTFAQSFKILFASMGPVGWAITIVTAALAALVPLAGTLYKAFKDNSPEGQLKLLEDRAKKSAEAFEEVKQEINEVQSALDKISSSYTTLEQLTVGTEEWYKALTDVNAEVLKLIEKYPDLELYKYISTDINGVMRLNEEGFKAISDYNQGIYAASQNVSINDQKAVNAQRQEVLFNKTSDLEYEVAMGKDEVTARAAAEFYQDPRIGETLFTEAGAKALFESVFQTQDSLIAEYEKLGYSSESAVEDFNSGVSQMYDYLKENEEIIKEVASLNKTNQMLDDSQLANVLSAINTNRDVNQTKDLMGDDFSYSKIVQDSRKEVEDAFGNWNDSINYKKNDNEWKYIQDFIKLQGKDLEYKAQQWGKMVFEDEEGKEYKFSKDEVYDALGELYAPQEFENQLANKIKENLKGTLSNINLDELNNEELFNLDSFQNQLKEAFKQDGESGNKIADALFQEVVGEFGTNTVELNNFLSKINSINLQDVSKLREFNNAAKELEEGKISIEEFADTMDELKAATDLDNMTSKFKEAAESMGLKEEDAGKMQEYARNLMELSESSDTLDENLKKDAESAADLAIEITRMNKGIDSLADGFKNWSDIIKNSSKESMEFSEAMYEIKQALSDVLDVEADLISSDFVEEHLDDIKKASEGNAEAIDKLRAQMDEEIIQKVTLGQSEDFAANVKELENSFKTELERINMEIPDIEVGAILQDEGFLEAANKLVQESNMTADEANAYFAGIGYEPVYSTEDIETPAQSPNASTTMTVTSLGSAQDPISIMGHEIGFLKMPQLTMETRSTPLDPVESEANMRLMSFSGDKTPPKIRGLRKKATGSQNNYSTKNSGGGKPGSSKKSGGGGSKSKDPQKMDPLKEVRDRYHDINNELKKLNTQLERQDRITSKLTGADRIKALNKQLDILESQKEVQQAKLNLLKDEQNELKNSLQGQGVGFNGDEIAGFNGALAAKEAYVNSLIAQYNGMSAEEQEAFKETIEQAKEDYEQFKKDMERYEEIILDEIPEAQDAINEAFDKQIELQIEAMEIEIELKLDLQDAKRQLEEFLSDIFVEDNDYVGKQQHIVNQIPTYLEDEKGTVAVNQAARNKALQAYETIKAGGIDDVYGDDAAKAWEDVLKYQDATMDAIRDAKTALEDVEQLYLDGIDAANEAFDEHLEKYEDINDELEHYLRVTELLKGEEAYEEQIAYYDQMEKNNIARMEFLRGEVAFWEEQMAKEEEGSEAWKKAQENAVAAQKELNNLVEESIEIAQKKFEATVKLVMKSITDAATDGMGLDYVKEQWELINKEADMYLDKINGAYEIGKLESKMLKALDNTSSVKSRERISELMNDELGKLREKDKLSQYEVDRANALFDLELKKIALEEAQRNKSTMRLRRDSQGNYTYQYTSDSDAIADAQAEVDEAQNALYNLDLDVYKDNLDKSLELFDEWQAKRQEIMIKYAGDEEKMKEHLALVDKEYEDMITFNTEQNEIIRKNLQQSTFESLAEMRDLDIEDFNNMTLEEQRIIMESMVPFWNTGVQAMTDKFAGKDDSFIEVCEAGFTRLDGTTQAYKTSLDAIGEAAGTNLGAISSGQQTVLGEILQLQTENSILFDQYDTTLGKLRENVEVTKEWVEKLQEVAREAENAMNKVIALRQQEINNLGGGGLNSGSGSSGGGSNNGGSGGKGSSSSSNKTGSSGGNTNGSNPNDTIDSTSKTPTTTKKEEHATVIGYVWIKSGTDARIGKLWSNGAIQYKTTIPFTSLATHPIYGSASQAPRSFKTGGYTGAWANGDSEGKFALLHQKELVLNAKDTVNILDAVNLVRGLEDSLNSRMFNLTNASALDKLYNLLEEKMSKEESTQMEQNIHIEANFPGVSVEKEISDAFDSLITKMSQKMYSTKR